LDSRIRGNDDPLFIQIHVSLNRAGRLILYFQSKVIILNLLCGTAVALTTLMILIKQFLSLRRS